MATALTELRRTRRAHRLGDAEWFDLAYRVYLAGIFGGSAVIMISDAIGDDPMSPTDTADVFAHGPAVLGLVAIMAIAAGLRSGTEGGPISIEAADVRHLLLAPISRGAVLRRPLAQRIRSVTFSGVLAGGISGLLAAQRLPGTAPAWTMSGAVFGACIGALVIGCASISHASRLRRWVVTLAAVPFVIWQLAAIASDVTGPADAFGSLALWGYRQHSIDLVAVAFVVATTLAALLLAGRLRIEHLARRGDLVSQLRFAVTMQDLRTVVLLRRQLRQEQPRLRPWIRFKPADGGASGAAVRRSLRSLGRLPAARLGRMALVAIVAGALAGVAALGSSAAIAGVGMLLFVFGLDLIEPLSQEIDHPDRTMAFPLVNGWLHERLLVGPLLLSVPFALIAATACSWVAPGSASAAFVLAIPMMWCGVAGSVVNTVRDDHVSEADPNSLVVPPEMAGFQDLIRLAVPVLVSSIGTATILAVRYQPDVGMVARCFVGLVLYLAVVRWWVVHRAELRQRWKSFVAGAQP